MQGILGLLILSAIGAEECPASKSSPAPACCAEAASPELWELILRDAIRIGVDNSEAIRVVTLGTIHRPISMAPGADFWISKDRVISLGQAGPPPPLVIAPRSEDATRPRFEAEVMAHVRSIEQLYWGLAQQYVQLQASEKAVELAEEVLKREQSEMEAGRGTVADVAEAQQRLEQFRLDVVTKTPDVMTAEGRLRNALGLPLMDSRRIVPVTPPVEARVEPSWDDCLASMRATQPDVVERRAAVQEAEARCLLGFAREFCEGFLGTPETQAEASAAVRSALEAVRGQRALLEQVVHQTTHSLARSFLEVDANYKQFRAAARLRAAAEKRLQAQRAFFEGERISIDRYLDAVSQYAGAAAMEAQYRTSYNVSIVALEEARGTLLAFDGITVVDPAGPMTASRPAADPSLGRASHEAKAEEPADAPCACEAGAAEAKPAAGTTFTFRFNIGGARPIEIKGEMTVRPTASPSPLPTLDSCRPLAPRP